MKNFKLQIYTVIVLSGIIMVFMVDGIQDEESIANTPSTADQIFASTSSQIQDPFNSIPPNWSRVEPKSSMRLAEYLVETTKGSYSVIVFKNIGGNQDQNIERWFNQFSGERIPELKQHSESMDIRESQLTLFKHLERLMAVWDKVSPWTELVCLVSLLIQIMMCTTSKQLLLLI